MAVSLFAQDAKTQTTHSAGKVMVIVFWDRRGVLLIDSLLAGTTINSNGYCETLGKFRRTIPNRIRGILNKGVSIFHDNARLHVAHHQRREERFKIYSVTLEVLQPEDIPLCDFLATKIIY